MIKAKTCTIAIVGAGNIAREHIRAFKDISNVEVTGIQSRTRSRAEKVAAAHHIPHVCDSISELYERTHADLVVIAIDIININAVSQACFEFPWTVLMEKPVGYNLPDAQKIRDAARARDRRVIVGLNRRFLSSTRAALTDLGGHDLPRFIHVQDQQSLAEATRLGHPKRVVENWMYANSIHLVDYLCLFGRGEVTSIQHIARWSPQRPQVVLAGIKFDSGDVGLYEGIWDGPGPWAVSVTTSEKRWEMRPLEQATFQVRGERKTQAAEISHYDRDFKPGFRVQAEMAVATAMGRPSDAPTLDDALKTMALIKEIFANE